MFIHPVRTILVSRTVRANRDSFIIPCKTSQNICDPVEWIEVGCFFEMLKILYQNHVMFIFYDIFITSVTTVIKVVITICIEESHSLDHSAFN